MAQQLGSRAHAALLLQQVFQHQGSLATVLADKSQIADSETREFCYGVMRWYFQLQALTEQLLSKPLRRKDDDVRALLLLGLYQLLYMRVPAHAAVSETVQAVGQLKKPWARGLINAVLRNFQRQQQHLFNSLTAADLQAFPDWLFERIQQAWPDQADSVFSASNSRPPMTLRVNSSLISRADYLRLLSEAGLSARPGLLGQCALTLEQAVEVSQLPGFDDGLVSVQDEAAQLAGELLPLQPGDRVLDACCAPGGKTGHLLEKQAEIKLDAIDNSAHRLTMVASNLKRLSLNARLIEADAGDLSSWPTDIADGCYQHILLDVPCSASGVIRRNPDIKYLRQSADLAGLAAQQRHILQACWTRLAPGGSLLYVTCSILPEENEQIVAGFLETQEDATHDPIAADWGVARRVGRQLLPCAHDGFYYARLRKSASKMDSALLKEAQ